MAYQTEGAVATDNSPTLAQPTLTLNRAVGFVPVSRELYADWNGALDQLGAEFQRAKDDLEATKFAVGTGTNEPQGLVTGATQTETATGVATIAPVDLYDTEQVLPARYRDRAHWFANKTIINDLLKDLPTNAGAAGIWLPSGRPEDQRGNTGYTLIGYEANEASGMASVLTTGTKVAILGDPSMFLIVDHVGGLEVEVIAHLTQQATAGAGVGLPTGQRGIWAVFRNTSKVLDASAFRALITG